MGYAARAAVFIVGAAFIAVLFLSMFNVGLLSRRWRDPIALSLRYLVIRAFVITLRASRYERIQDGLAWILPAFVICLISSWFALAQAGFTLMIWASGAEDTWLTAFIASGSALSTLGFFTPKGITGHLLTIPEGALGLGIVVFFFTYLPGYQSAIQLRESNVVWVYARTGGQGGDTLLEWFWRANDAAALAGVWANWEAVFNQLAETHTLSPALAFVPSVYDGQAWVVAALSVLDAAALNVSSLDTGTGAAASICIRAGETAMRQIGALLPASGMRDEEPYAATSIDRPTYDSACARLLAAGAPVRPDRETAWREFVHLRQGYTQAVDRVARATLLPTALLHGIQRMELSQQTRT